MISQKIYASEIVILFVVSINLILNFIITKIFNRQIRKKGFFKKSRKIMSYKLYYIYIYSILNRF